MKQPVELALDRFLEGRTTSPISRVGDLQAKLFYEMHAQESLGFSLLVVERLRIPSQI